MTLTPSQQFEMHADQWLLLAATAIMTWWVVQYTLSSPWWKDRVGRNFVLKDALLLALLIPSCLVQVWRGLLTVTDGLTIELGVFGGIAVVMATRCLTWWHIQPPRPRLMWRAIWHRNGKFPASSPHRHCATCRCTVPEPRD